MTKLPHLLIGGRAPRVPFRAHHLPPIAKLCRLAFRVYQRRWAKRLLKFPARLLFDSAYHGLRLGGQGTIEVGLPGGPKNLSFDARHLHFYATYKTRNEHGHEPEVASLLDTLLSGDRVFYDVGANWGYFTLYVATIADFHGPIHAFEPIPGTFADLQDVVQQLGLAGRVSCHSLAASNQSGEGAMTIPDPLHTGIARLVDPGKATGRSGMVRVPLARLDDLKLPPPFLMKVDVEEHEFEALCGAEALLRKERPFLIFENWIQKTRPVATLEPLRYLESLGYVLFDPCWSYRDGEDHYVWPAPDPPARSGPSVKESRQLALVRFSAEQRLALREQINVFACHRERLASLDGVFESRFSPQTQSSSSA